MINKNIHKIFKTFSFYKFSQVKSLKQNYFFFSKKNNCYVYSIYNTKNNNVDWLKKKNSNNIHESKINQYRNLYLRVISLSNSISDLTTYNKKINLFISCYLKYINILYMILIKYIINFNKIQRNGVFIRLDKITFYNNFFKLKYKNKRSLKKKKKKRFNKYSYIKL